MGRPQRSYQCGTYEAYQAHRRRGETFDDACRAANSAYKAKWRAASPVGRRNEIDRSKARERAQRALARRHPDEFRELLHAELRKIHDPAAVGNGPGRTARA